MKKVLIVLDLGEKERSALRQAAQAACKGVVLRGGEFGRVLRAGGKGSRGNEQGEGGKKVFFHDV